MSLPWTEKYRPLILDDIYSQDELVNTLKKFITNNCLPHLLFYGLSGTGKTSCITACAKEIYGSSFPYMVMELNASDDRGIEIVRTKIKKFVKSKGMFNNMFKLVVLDETDAMTADAQAILRKIMEDYTYNTRFCLICNYIQNIDQALQSRCTKFRFSLLQEDMIKKRIIEICKLEDLNITKSGLNTLVQRSYGDMRKAINILQSSSMIYETINSDNINKSIGHPTEKQMDHIIDILFTRNVKDSYDEIMEIKNRDGLSLNDILLEIHNILINYLRTKNYKYLSEEKIIFILDQIRTIEYNQYSCVTDNIQLSALIGLVKDA